MCNCPFFNNYPYTEARRLTKVQECDAIFSSYEYVCSISSVTLEVLVNKHIPQKNKETCWWTFQPRNPILQLQLQQSPSSYPHRYQLCSQFCWSSTLRHQPGCCTMTGTDITTMLHNQCVYNCHAEIEFQFSQIWNDINMSSDVGGAIRIRTCQLWLGLSNFSWFRGKDNCHRRAISCICHSAFTCTSQYSGTQWALKNQTCWECPEQIAICSVLMLSMSKTCTYTHVHTCK